MHGIYWKSNRIETVAVNTDEEHLRKLDAHKKVLIGKDVAFGKDAGGFPEVGEHCAEKARNVIREALKGYDIVFVVAGMGGGTGTGVSPVVASVAKEMNAVTFGLPIMPFDHEGGERKRVASEGVQKLRGEADFTIVLDNNKLMNFAADLPVAEAPKIVDRSVLRIIEAVSSQTTSYGPRISCARSASTSRRRPASATTTSRRRPTGPRGPRRSRPRPASTRSTAPRRGDRGLAEGDREGAGEPAPSTA